MTHPWDASATGFRTRGIQRTRPSWPFAQAGKQERLRSRFLHMVSPGPCFQFLLHEHHHKKQQQGGERGRIHMVESLGPLEDEPNVANKRFSANPTWPYRALVVTEPETPQGDAPRC